MIHRVRLFYSTAGASSFHDWLSTWLTNMSPWEADRVVNEIPSSTTSTVEGDEHYRVELAFSWSEDRAIIIDNLESYLQEYCSWSKIGYHECTHDAESSSPCTWDEQRTHGPVPNAINELQ